MIIKKAVKELILNPHEFEKVRKVQVEILIEFDRICQKNNIHYNLYFGTMLGAVRHQGFIPWDDDIDVAMTRENYNKFLSVYSKDLENDYFVQTYESDPNFFRPFARVRKNDTIYKQRHYQNLNIHHGVFIDVFPLDSVYENQAKEYLRYRYLHRLRRLNVIKHFGVDKDANLVKKKMQQLIDRVLPGLKFNQYITKVMTKRNRKNLDYLNHLTDGTESFKYKLNLVKKEDFLDSTLVNFEGNKFPIPVKYDKYLTRIYGDYMKLPPKENRIPHHQVIQIKI